MNVDVIVDRTPTMVITSLTWREALHDGTPIYLSRDPRLPGCVADGDTAEEAEANLQTARLDYIDSMIENGLEPPDWYDPNEHWEPVE